MVNLAEACVSFVTTRCCAARVVRASGFEPGLSNWAAFFFAHIPVFTELAAPSRYTYGENNNF
jgi:hypothetical protein